MNCSIRRMFLAAGWSRSAGALGSSPAQPFARPVKRKRVAGG